MKLLNLILKILVLTCLGVALLEGNTNSILCASVLLVAVELEKICDAIREKKVEHECNSDLQKH